MMHMHVRRPDGRHLLDAQAYRDALAAVRKAVGDELLVQVTSEAAGVYRAAEQMAMVRELAPEAVPSACARSPCPRSRKASWRPSWHGWPSAAC